MTRRGARAIFTAGHTQQRVVPEDFGAYDVECPICGTMDNHARHRRGLCCECYCSLSNMVGEGVAQTMPKDELITRGRIAALAALRRGSYPIGQRNYSALRRFAAAHGIIIASPRAPQEEEVATPVIYATSEAARAWARKDYARKRGEAIRAKYGSGFKTEELDAAELLRRKRERAQQWRDAHREEVRAYNKEYKERRKSKRRLMQ